MRDPTEPPQPRKAKDQDGKAGRLAGALRANLARRKAQKRARETVGDETGGGNDAQNDDNDSARRDGHDGQQG